MRNELKELIKEVIEDFNRDYYPEVIVNFIGNNEKGDLAFVFEGNFCITCGMYDYFLDFAERLKKILGERFVVSDKYGLNEGYDGWVVIYSKSDKAKKEDAGKFLVLDPKTGKIIRKIKVNEIK